MPTASRPDRSRLARGVSAEPASTASLAGDDIGQGKAEFRANNYIVAEQHFAARSKAIRTMPTPGSGWRRSKIGCGASISPIAPTPKAIGIAGPTAEILNNQGYSYMLRGDSSRARAKLVAAQRKDPQNKFVAEQSPAARPEFAQGQSGRPRLSIAVAERAGNLG